MKTSYLKLSRPGLRRDGSMREVIARNGRKTKARN